MAVTFASRSKPKVAFTRSRRMRRAGSGSPLKNRVAASSRSALANAGSRSTRATTVFLKLRVSAMSIPFAFFRLIGRGLRGLAGLVFRVQYDGSIYIRLLPAFRAAAKQNNESVAVLSKIDPIARPPVDDVFADTCEPLDVGGIAKLQTQCGGHDLRGCLRVKAIEPGLVRVGAIRANVFFDPNTHYMIVT